MNIKNILVLLFLGGMISQTAGSDWFTYRPEFHGPLLMVQDEDTPTESEPIPENEYLTGKLLITTDPPGAEIWIDDEKIDGVTPLTVEDISAEEHKVYAESRRISAQTFETIEPNAIKEIHLVLSEAKGSIQLNSNPSEAIAYVDGEEIGITPVYVSDLTVGKHRIVVKKGDFSSSSTVIVDAYETEEVHLTLSYVLGKYPARSLAMSLILPGTGQWYAGAKIKSLFFIGAEIAGWTAWSIMKKNGDDKQIEFETFADEHWDFYSWWKNIVDPDPILEGQFGEDGEYSDVRIDGTHHLNLIIDGSVVPSDTLENMVFNDTLNIHVIRDRDFYENIGKYNQFSAGWDDILGYDSTVTFWAYENSVGDTIVMTNNRDNYLDIRYHYNRYLSYATYSISAVMFNHIISAVDAVWTTRKRAKKQSKVETSVNLQYSPYNRFGIGGLKFSFNW
tara:strand:+ start:3987 stop:5330 length:1344 start_codon:yes stop_codon:yes gene_type:complete